MSITGVPTFTPPKAPGAKVVIVASSWHEEIVSSLIHNAHQAVIDCTGRQAELIRTQGVLEIPVVTQQLVPYYDAVVALGVVIEGETPHFNFVAESVTKSLLDISVQAGTPVGQGILTTHTLEQAINRAGFKESAEDKGTEATYAALSTHTVLSRIQST